MGISPSTALVLAALDLGLIGLCGVLIVRSALGLRRLAEAERRAERALRVELALLWASNERTRRRIADVEGGGHA